MDKNEQTKFDKIFPPPPEGQILCFNAPSARYGTAEMFRLSPYQGNHPGTQKYGIISCDGPGQTNQYTGQPKVQRASVLVEILDPKVAEEAEKIYGGLCFDFFKRQDGWGVAFKSETIIAAHYLKLSDADMEKLMSEGGIILR